MSLSATLSNALSGLNVAQHALSLTAHNIVNANTEGYTRKTANPEAHVVAARGAGVRSGDVEREVDRFLTQQIRRQSTATGEAEAIDRFHGRLQDFLGRPGQSNDLALRIAALEDGFETLAASPETGALRTEILSDAEDLTAGIQNLAGDLQRLRADADQEIGIAIRQINDESEQIADLNAEIVRLKHLDQTNPELLDRRDALVRSIAEKIDISTYVQADGALVVQTGVGVPLVDETARVMVYEPAQQVDAATVFGAITAYHRGQIDPATGEPDPAVRGVELVSAGVRATLNAELLNDATADGEQTITTMLRGGQIVGLLAVRDRILPELDDQIQELAAGLRFTLNAAHNQATAVPPPTSLAGTRTDLSAFAAAGRSGTATVAVIDRADGSTLADFALDLGAAANENDIVTQLNAGLGGLGTATIGADGALRIDLADTAHGVAVDEGDSAVTVQDPAGRDRTYGFSHYFGLNDFMVQERTRPSSIAVRPEILADPGRIGTAVLDVSGPPVPISLGGSGDNRGALGIASALRAGQDVIARGALPAGTIRLEDYAARIIATTSAAASQARETAANERSLTEAFDFRAAAISGVNVDEEMSRLVQLQKSYTVAARLISITDEMFDELFRAAQ